MSSIANLQRAHSTSSYCSTTITIEEAQKTSPSETIGTFSHKVSEQLSEDLRPIYRLVSDFIDDHSLFSEVIKKVNEFVTSHEIFRKPEKWSDSWNTPARDIERRFRLIKDRLLSEENPNIRNECNCLIAMMRKVMLGDRLFVDVKAVEIMARAIIEKRNDELVKLIEQNILAFPGGCRISYVPPYYSYSKCIHGSLISIAGTVGNIFAVTMLLQAGADVDDSTIEDTCSIGVFSNIYLGKTKIEHTALNDKYKINLLNLLCPVAYMRHNVFGHQVWRWNLSTEYFTPMINSGQHLIQLMIGGIYDRSKKHMIYFGQDRRIKTELESKKTRKCLTLRKEVLDKHVFILLPSTENALKLMFKSISLSNDVIAIIFDNIPKFLYELCPQDHPGLHDACEETEKKNASHCSIQ